LNQAILIGGSKIKAIKFSGGTPSTSSSPPDSMGFFTEAVLMLGNFNSGKAIFTEIISFFLTAQTKAGEKKLEKKVFNTKFFPHIGHRPCFLK